MPPLACFDNQTEAQKAKNYKLVEFVSAVSPVEWIEKTVWKELPFRNQKSSLTCVPQTSATEIGIIFKQKYGEWVNFSASFLYQQRGGDYGGTSSDDIYTRFPKLGNLFEMFMPSQNMNETEVLAVERKNYYKELALPFSIKRIELPVDFETVCSTIQSTEKGIMLWVHIGENEWTTTPTFLNTPVKTNHSITAIDFGLKNGKKFIRITDSSGACYRDISEEYFKARCYLASYLKTFQTLTVTEDTVKPIFNGSVKSLQEILIFEGFLAVGLNTNFFGNLTRTALAKWQLKHNINPPKGYFGNLTKEYLYFLYP